MNDPHPHGDENSPQLSEAEVSQLGEILDKEPEPSERLRELLVRSSVFERSPESDRTLAEWLGNRRRLQARGRDITGDDES